MRMIRCEDWATEYTEDTLKQGPADCGDKRTEDMGDEIQVRSAEQ